MAKKIDAALLRKRGQMFEAIKNGETFSVVAYRFKIGANALTEMMNNYGPYIDWVNERRENPELLEAEARGLIEDGKTVRFIEEHFCLDPIEADHLVKRIQRTYGGTAYRLPGEKDIFVSDVERFKNAIGIGEVLVCGVSPEGLLILCRVLRKHKHFAATDLGSFEWNWLCVKNKEKIPR